MAMAFLLRSPFAHQTDRKRTSPAFGKDSRMRRRGTMRQALSLSLLGLAFLFPTSVLQAASSDDTANANANANSSTTLPEYRLNVRDRLRIQVFEWRPSRDEVFTWTALNQIYTIDPAGKISLPLVGSVKAVGYTTSELETIVSRQLAKRLHLAALPNTTVEVTDFRPIYVTGAVEKSGEYPYTAGMTVLQGLSLGGGLYRNTAMGGLRLQREWLTTAGNYQAIRQERLRLLAHKARLDAELASADRIAFPGELDSLSEPAIIQYSASIMNKEQSVFELRKKANETQLIALNQLQDSLEREVDTLDKRIKAQDKQIALTQNELDGLQALNNKGLVTQPRLLGLKRNLVELQGEKLRIESERTRAQQEVSRTKLSKIEYQNKRDNDMTVELQTTESRLQDISHQAQVDRRLLAETRSQVAKSPYQLASLGNGSNADNNSQPAIHYTIARQVGDHVIEIEATEQTLLQPGDTVKVELSIPAINNEFGGLGMGLGLDADYKADDAPPRKVPADNLRRQAPTRASLEQVNITPQRP
jgi:protein involved in polysaccharide export with SLBB domain